MERLTDRPVAHAVGLRGVEGVDQLGHLLSVDAHAGIPDAHAHSSSSHHSQRVQQCRFADPRLTPTD
jgi:hypothetical protein